MLPWSRRELVPDRDNFARVQGFEDIGDDPILGPITTPDDIAGSSRCDPKFRRVREERATVGGSDQFRATFGGAVGIVATHGVFFAVGVEPFAVLVAFIGGDDDTGAWVISDADGVEHVGGSHDVGGKSFHRDVEREPHERLGREVEDKIGANPFDGFDEKLAVSDISAGIRRDTGSEVEKVKESFVGLRIEGVAMDLGAEPKKPLREPASFESGVAGDQHRSVFENGAEHGEVGGVRVG